MFLAELNEMELCAGDIGNAYLEAFTKEHVFFVAGAEFGALAGHVLIIEKALYGLKSSGARYYEKFAGSMSALNWKPSKADPDVWMKDCGDHWEYVCTWVDDLLYAGSDGEGFFQELRDIGYKLKGVGEPSYHLGGDFKRVTEPENMLLWGSYTYIKKMLSQYELMFDEPVPNKKIHAPLVPGDHPEIDDSDFLGQHETSIYLSMIGAMQWAVALGRIDIFAAVMTMSRFRAAPRVGHLERLKRIYGYLRQYKKTAIKFRTEMPDYSAYKTEDLTWGHVYHPCKEDIPEDKPEPKGKLVRTSTFVDANLMHDLITGRSATGIIHLLNKTPISWFSKRQNTCETATYGSEFVAARIGVDQIIDLRYTLRMLGVPLDGPSWMFGDNLSVIQSSTIPSSSLKKRHNALCYHRVREAQACGVIRFCHIPGKDNPADICTKHMSSREWFPLMKPLIFWTWRDNDEQAVVADAIEGSVNLDAVPVTVPVVSKLATMLDGSGARSS